MYSTEDFRLVKPIFNKIRKYSAPEILAACINKIRYAEEVPHNRYGKYQPWTLLLLIKWTLLYGDLRGAFPPVVFSEKHLNKLLNDLHELHDRTEGKTARLRDETGWFFFFRKIAFQQFPFQELTYVSRFARQCLLFGHLQADDPLRQKFLGRVGAAIEDILELSFVVLARFFLQKQPFVTADWFGTLARSYTSNTIQTFLRELSKDFDSVRDFLAEGRAVHPPEVKYELAEMSPFRRFPLLQLGSKYYCYSPTLTYRALEHFVYDTLRDHDAQAFGNHFGKRIFEEYVGRAVAHTRLTVITERELQEELGQKKAVDYLIVDAGAHIYIDAKAVEITYIGEVTENPDTILQRIESSVLKGIDQAYSLAQSIEGMTGIGAVSVGSPEERYLLIVTYKDLYLGCGRDFYHYIARKKLDEILQRYGNVPRIPFEHIYVISIEDFDLFVQIVHEGKVGMAEFLRLAVAADATSFFETRKLVFRQHLHEIIGDLNPPTYLDQEFAQMMQRMEVKFR